MGYLFCLGAGGGTYPHSSRHIIALLRAVWKSFSCGLREYIRRPVYLLCTTDPGHWTDPSAFLATLSAYLDEAGILYTVLDTYDKIYNTLWTATPPERAIIINLHGEGQPIPPQLYDIWDEVAGTFVANYRDLCASYYSDLGARIRDYGWLVIEPIGYTYYNAMQSGHCTCEIGALGAGSINNCVGVVGLSTDCWGSRAYDVRDCCALKRCWNPAWGAISRSVSRFPRPAGDFNYWQFNFKNLTREHSAGAFPFYEPTGYRLFV